jgi:single-stranded-DNA-specific exonuclease
LRNDADLWSFRVPPRPIWIEPAPLPSTIPQLDHDPVVNELLWRRGIDSPEAALQFLTTTLSAAPDPLLLPNMAEAADRVTTALATGEKIGIFGDYDVDGITATALLMIAVQPSLASDDQVIARLPHRDEGYGLNLAAIEEFHSAGVSLLIAVDCGSSDHTHVAAARERGMDVVIIDHHVITGSAPDGAIVVSARLNGISAYWECCSAALAYLFISVLAQRGVPVHGGDGRPETDLLDLAALGTIGDVSPLTGVNRAFVRDGVRVMQQAPRPGIHALCNAANVAPAALLAESIPFRLTPRLNAAGRLGDPRIALDLLLASDTRVAFKLAQEIDALNTKRRLLGERIAAEAEALIAADPVSESRRAFVLCSDSWHPGVIGIVAGRLANQYGRPVIVLSDDGTVGRGSARSVAGVDLMAALEPHRELFERFGGHSQAAGMTIDRTRVDDLRERLEAAVEALGVDIPAPPAIAIDIDLPHHLATLTTFDAIERLQPFGVDNERPVVMLRDVRVQESAAIGQDRTHLRMTVATLRGPLKVLFWGAASRIGEAAPGARLDLAGTLKRDTWNGRDRLQMELKDFRPA